MSDKEFLTNLVQEKIDRQAELRGLKRTLGELDSNLSSSRFGRFFGSSYWFVKRWVTLCIGLAMIVFGVLFIVEPSSIIKEGDQLFEYMIVGYQLFFGAEVAAAVVDLANTISTLESPTREELVVLLDNQADEYMAERLYLHLGLVGVVLIIMSSFMLYISRQARKVKLRNTKLNEAENLTKGVSQAFQEVIDEEEKELERLKLLLQRL